MDFSEWFRGDLLLFGLDGIGTHTQVWLLHLLQLIPLTVLDFDVQLWGHIWQVVDVPSFDQQRFAVVIESKLTFTKPTSELV